MSGGEEYDSDAPEELTSEQGVKQDEKIRVVQKQNKARVVREGKERRRQWAQKLTPRSSKKIVEVVQDEDTDTKEEASSNGMLPHDIVQLLAAQEKQVFFTDSEDEKTEMKPKKKKVKTIGLNTVILKDIPPPRCIESALDFLKERKMRLHRSSAILNNSSQARHFLATSALSNKKKKNCS